MLCYNIPATRENRKNGGKMKINRQKIKVQLWIIWFAATNIFRKTYIANMCGHRTKKEGATESFGERYVMGMPLAKNCRPDYCLECIGKMAIRCGWCGKPIHIGDLVTPYLAKPDMPDYTRYHQDSPTNSRTLVGCPRTTCADTGADYHGSWIPPGKVARFPSIIERLAGAVAVGDDCVVIMVRT
jgi:hypothetical protein